MGLIYSAYCNESRKYYIGQTICTMKTRMNQHRLYSEKGSQYKFYRAIRKYGWHSFTWKTIETVEDSLLDERESFWIINFDSMNNGYNSTAGGSGIRGMKHSEDTIRKISISNTGIKRSDEIRKRMRVPKPNLIGKPRSKETKDKISSSVKKVWKSEDHRKLTSEKATGKRASDQTRLKISRAKTGSTVSEETRKKISESMKRYRSIRP